MGLLAHFLLQNGVGQNLTAGVIVFCLGVVWSRTRYWPLHAIHAHLEALHGRHDTLEDGHAALHARLQRIEALLTPEDEPRRRDTRSG